MNYVPVFGDYIGEWHRIFCILPRRTYDGRIAWLRKVYRRRVQLKLYLRNAPTYWWMYSLDKPTV